MSSTRRTQDERRTETRRRLLDATIRCLGEYGYAGSTTRRIAEQADVSVGAVTHHFPYRVDLVTAAVEELVHRRIDALRGSLERLPEDRTKRIGGALDMLWLDFSGPLFPVMVKLWVAAGDDAELYERMVPLERSLARAVAELAPELGMTDSRTESAGLGIAPRYAVVIAAIRGLALSRAFEPRSGQVRDPWPAVRDELERYLLS